MIDQIDSRLRDWIVTVLGDVTISLRPPGAETAGQGVSLYLLELVDDPPLRGQQPAQYRLSFFSLDSARHAYTLLKQLDTGSIPAANIVNDP